MSSYWTRVPRHLHSSPGDPLLPVPPWRKVAYVVVEFLLWAAICFMGLVILALISILGEGGLDSLTGPIYIAMFITAIAVTVGLYVLTRVARRINGTHPTQLTRVIPADQTPTSGPSAFSADMTADQVWGTAPNPYAPQPAAPPVQPSAQQGPAVGQPDDRFPYGRPADADGPAPQSAQDAIRRPEGN